jgi:hypothetical protein
LETSVFIGFAFPDDRWETAAKACLAAPQKKYTSQTVENEFSKKMDYSIRTIQRELLGFLRDLKHKRGTDIFDDAGRKRLLDKTRELKIWPFLKSMVSDLDPLTTYIALDDRLRELLHEFLAEVFARRTFLRTRINSVGIESWLRVDDYGTVQRQLRAIIPNPDDVEILLDAHDLTCHYKLELAFVTGDWKDIKQHEAQITSSTGIKRIVYLAEFEPGKGD